MEDFILSNISKKYGNKQVINNFSYVFHEKSKTCIMGPSGLGKSTLANIILGIDKDFVGEISGVKKWSAVFQECRMVENISAISNVRMTAPDTVTEQEITEAFEYLIPEETCKKQVSKQSGGMKRRTEIIRAMLSDSDAVLMDEPFAGLDEKVKEKTIEFILSKLNGRILIVITHDKNDAKQLGADICLLTRNMPIDTI